MTSDPFASRLAPRIKLPVALVGVTSAALGAANLLSESVPDKVATYAAVGVGAPAALLFFCMVFDMRFQRAVSALNAERRGQFRAGRGVSGGDPLLLAIAVALIMEGLAAGGVFHRAPTAALAFAACALVIMANIALMVRGYPSDAFKDFFS
jgi:hypothetical protein